MAKNEYGVTLDRNGYAPSIVRLPHIPDPQCYLCGRTTGKLDRHEIFGASCRKKSKNLGLWVLLCRHCHEAATLDRSVNLRLKCHGQRLAEIKYGWTHDDFRREFGRNYLGEEDG